MKLELKAVNPVAAVLNFLPINWEARIVKVIKENPLGSGLLFSQWKILCILSYLIGQ